MKSLEFVDKTLTEVAMSPTRLQQMAANINAIAGMEFEMIVPNAADSGDEAEMEEDWDQDERCRSFQDIKLFFYDGNHNSRTDVNSYLEELQSDYDDWVSEKEEKAWKKEGRDFFTEYIEDDFDEESALTQAKEEIHSEFPDIDWDSEKFLNLVNDRVNDLKEEWLDGEWEYEGRLYNRAKEEWSGDWETPDEEDYLLHLGIRYMSDVVAKTNALTWPHWVSSGSSSEERLSEIATSFGTALKRPYNFSTGYHGATRSPNKYVIEPDGSLDPDDDDDSGLEFISPPLPINELISDLKKVKVWAKRNNCYTNDSCGLHMNVSVPGYNIAKLDYVKLALLSGDTWVLDQFGRLGNTYAKSAMKEIKKRITDNPADSEALLKTMKSRMDALASKIIHSGNTAKYTSINTKDGWVEFRSPGGDWLNDDLDKLTNTLLRFVVALDAALDPQKFRQEYLKKLYSILKPTSETDPLSYFASYSAGALSKEELKKFVQQSKLERDIKKSGTGNSKYWWKVNYGWAGSSIEVVASSAQEALAKARQEWDLSPTSVSDGQFEVKPIRPYP